MGKCPPTLPVGGATKYTTGKPVDPVFQSTLPVGGATKRDKANLRRAAFQSTLPVGGATFWRGNQQGCPDISIHAPRGGERRVCDGPGCGSTKDFNPRSPWGERLLDWGRRDHPADFNPRSPWGERPPSGTISSISPGFQSTLPVGGATAKMHNLIAHLWRE